MISATDYLPFGMAARIYNNENYRYSFQGMEKNEEWNEGSYDFGARMYDGRSGRWLATDPLAKSQPAWTPYKAMNDSPMFFADPDGKKEWDVINVIDKRSGQSVQFKILKSDKIMTDGAKHSVTVMGDEVYENRYYDFQNVTTIVIDVDGNPTITQSTKILYANKSKDADYIWGDGADKGDTKKDWGDWDKSKEGGIDFTSSTGEGSGHYSKASDIKQINIDDLFGISTGSKTAGAKILRTVFETLSTLVTAEDYGKKIGDAVRHVYSDYKAKKANEDKLKVCRDCGKTFDGNNKEVKDNKKPVKDTINVDGH